MSFIPLTNIYGIPGSSFGLQLGTNNRVLALQVYWGKKVYSTKTFNSVPLFEVNPSKITTYVLNILFIPNINPYQIDRIVRILITELKRSLKLK